jgi:peptidoglycan/xylan/chitin deacetylase (PgdA/CDA1 family)
VRSKSVPILITWDVDPDRWTTLENRQKALTRALDLCEEFNIHSTFFFTANYAHEYRDQIKRMQKSGQEIGCHGLTHTDEENYDRMPEEMQRLYLGEATRKLMGVIDSPVRAFRSPRVKTSAVTLRLLSELGYQADSSVCSQRMDLLSSNLINPRWLTAPRVSYHPDTTDAFRRGDLLLWELPVSALVVPLISGSLSVFGLNFIKIFVRLLFEESKRTGKPIVYLSHPTDMLNTNRKPTPITLDQFSWASIRTHGFRFRRIFFRKGGEEIFQATRELFDCIVSLPGTKFMTCSEYITDLENHLVNPVSI